MRQNVGGHADRFRDTHEADGIWLPGGTGNTDDPQNTRSETEASHQDTRCRGIPAFVVREVRSGGGLPFKRDSRSLESSFGIYRVRRRESEMENTRDKRRQGRACGRVQIIAIYVREIH